MLVDRLISETRVGEVIFPSAMARKNGCGYYTESDFFSREEPDAAFFPAIVIDPRACLILSPSGKLKTLNYRSLVSSESR